MNQIPQEIRDAVKQSIKHGATHYQMGAGCLTLNHSNGEESLRLPMFSADPAKNKALARFVLEELAWHDYQQAANKVVLVTTLSGYDGAYSYEMRFDAPIRVRVNEDTHPHDIERWDEGEYLDPIWDVTLLDTHVSEAAALTNPWIYGTSRSLSGRTQPGDVIRRESALEKLQRFASTIGLVKPRAPELLVRL